VGVWIGKKWKVFAQSVTKNNFYIGMVRPISAGSAIETLALVSI
jgi:hypothetical protein